MSVSDLVQKYVPNSWQADNSGAVLKGTVYNLFDVPRSSAEFSVVTKQCMSEGHRVTRVQRMQNIYMFGRYLLRHQQLLCRRPGRNIESQRYVCISEDKIDTLGTYNVDHRRLDLPAEAFNLYSTPTEALDRCTVSKRVLVICRVSREEQVTMFDSEIYPEYLAWIST